MTEFNDKISCLNTQNVVSDKTGFNTCSSVVSMSGFNTCTSTKATVINMSGFNTCTSVSGMLGFNTQSSATFESNLSTNEFLRKSKFVAREITFVTNYRGYFMRNCIIKEVTKQLKKIEFHEECSPSFMIGYCKNVKQIRKLQNCVSNVYHCMYNFTNQKVYPVEEVSTLSDSVKDFDFLLHKIIFKNCLGMIDVSRREVDPINISLRKHNMIKRNCLFRAQGAKENKFKSELIKFCKEEKNCFVHEYQKAELLPKEEFNVLVKNIMSVSLQYPNALPRLISLMRAYTNEGTKASLRTYDLIGSMIHRNTTKNIIRKKRDDKYQSQGLFDNINNAFSNVSDLCAKLIRADTTGMFTGVMEIINQINKNIESVGKTLSGLYASILESTSRMIFAFVLFYITIINSNNDKNLWIIAGMSLINSLPRALVTSIGRGIFCLIEDWFDSSWFRRKLVSFGLLKDNQEYLVLKERKRLFIEKEMRHYGASVAGDPDMVSKIVLRANELNSIDVNDPIFEEQYIAQGEKDENIISSIVGYFVAMFESKGTEEIKLENIRVNKILNVSKVLQSSKTVCEFIEKFIKLINDNVLTSIFGFSEPTDAYALIDKRIPKFLEEISLFEMMITDDGKIQSPIFLLSDFEKKVRLISLMKEGDEILKRLAIMYQRPNRMVVYFERKLNQLKELSKAVSATLVGMKAKHEPLTLYVHGDPGIGKSIMADFLLKDMYNALGENYDFARDKYMKNDTTLFWDGYDRQKVYVIDDVLQTQDADIKTQQVHDVMHIASRAPFPLNMADCQSKGTVNFASEVFLMTANQMFPKHLMSFIITEPEAFYRRLMIEIKVKLRVDFKNRNNRFNGNGVTDEDPFVRDAYLFEVTHRDGFAQDMDWEELVMYLAHTYEIHKDNQRKLDLVLESRPQDMREKYKKYREFVDEVNYPVDDEKYKQQGLKEVMASLTVPATYLAKAMFTRKYELFGFAFNPTINIGTDPKSRVIDDEKMRLYCNLTNDPVYKDPPTQAREEYNIMCEKDVDELKLKYPMLNCERIDTYNSDLNVLAQFNRGLLTETRLSFHNVRFQILYEGIRALATVNDLRFSVNQLGQIEMEKGDIVAIRTWIMYPSSKLSEDCILSDWGSAQFRLIKQKLTAVQASFKSDCNYDVFRSKLVEWMKHPLIIGFGVIVTALTAYKAYTYFQGEKKDIESKWETFMSEGMGSGDQRTTKPRRMRFTKNRYFKQEARGKSKEILVPHPHKCEACGNYFGHYHAFDEQKTHGIYPFCCPYEDCIEYWGNDPKGKKVAPNKVFKCAPQDVEYIDDEILVDKMKSQSAQDPQCMTVMSVLKEHIVNFHVEGGCYVRGIIICDRIILAPLHAFLGMKVDDCLVNVEGTTVKVSFHVEKFVIDKNTDTVLIQMPKTVPLKRNIISYFTSEDEYRNQFSDGYALKIIDRNTILYQQLTDIVCSKKVEYTIEVDDHEEIQYLANSYLYTGDLEAGDCGAPIIVCDKGVVKKVLGIHIAGITKSGMLSLITPEFLNIQVKRFSDWKAQGERDFPEEEIDVFYDCNDYPLHVEDNIEIIGVLKKEFQSNPKLSTKVTPSELHAEVFPLMTIPALLKRCGKLDPLRNDLVKQCTKEKLIDQKILDLAVDDLSLTINTYKSPYKKMTDKLINMKDNVNGINGDPYVLSLNFQSAVGFPWNKTHSYGSTKQKWFPGEIGKKMPRDEIVQKFEMMEEKAKSGVVPLVYFQDTLKDERRPIEKVHAGKTRIFSVPPVEFTLLVRKYFLNCVAHIMHNHVKGEVSVGLNVHSDEWKVFYEVAKANGHNWIAGDYGGYDKRLPYQVCMETLRIFDDYYFDDNTLVRSMLGEAMFSAIHIADNVVYQTHHGMPSGVPITAVFNSLVNAVLFRVAFLSLSLENGWPLEVVADRMSNYMQIRAYGDDHIVRVHEDVPFFNMITVSRFFASINLEYTTTTKEKASTMYVSDEDLTYLKRHFVLRDCILYAPLDSMSICEMINWTRKSDDNRLATIENVKMALMEMSHYTRKEWNIFYNLIKRACIQKSLLLKPLTFEMSRTLLRSGDMASFSVILPESETFYAQGNAAGKRRVESLPKLYLNGSATINKSLNVSDGDRDRNPSEEFVAKTTITFDKVEFVNQILRMKANRDTLNMNSEWSCLFSYVSTVDERAIFTLKTGKWSDLIDCQDEERIIWNEEIQNQVVLVRHRRDKFYSIAAKDLGPDWRKGDSICCRNVFSGENIFLFDFGFYQMRERNPWIVMEKLGGSLYRLFDANVFSEFGQDYLSFHDDGQKYLFTHERTIDYAWQKDENADYKETFIFKPTNKYQKGYTDYELIDTHKNKHFIFVPANQRGTYLCEIFSKRLPFWVMQGKKDGKAKIAVKSKDKSKAKPKAKSATPAKKSAVAKGGAGDGGAKKVSGVKKLNEEQPVVKKKQEKITQFFDVASEEKKVVKGACSDLKKLNPFPKPVFEDFWERVFPVEEFQWTAISDAGLFLKYISFPDALFKIDSIWDKLKNFRFAQFGVEISVRLNGTKFHYGQLMFSHFPNASNGLFINDINGGQKNLFTAYENVFTASGNKHIIVNPTENGIQKLRIEYNLPKPFIDLYDLCNSVEASRKREDNESELSGIGIFVLAPLRNPDKATNVSVTVFAKLINPVLTGFYQSKANKNYKDFVHAIYKPTNAVRETIGTTWSTNDAKYSVVENPMFENKEEYTKYVAQSKREALNKVKDDAVSSLLDIGKEAMAEIVVGGIKGAFNGFTRPNDVSKTSPMMIKYPNYSITHGLNEGYTLGIKEDNAVKSARCLTGGSHGEMLIKNIVTNYCLVGGEVIKSSNADGSRILSLEVTPSICHRRPIASPKNFSCLFPTHLSFVASRFRFWRGDITFKFVFICSSFHNGRYRISWIPKYSEDSKDLGNVLESNLMNKIVDLSVQTEVEFTVPYLNDEPYLETIPSMTNGSLIVTTINTLAYPGAIVPDISLLVWIKGEPNMSFALPQSTLYLNRWLKREDRVSKAVWINKTIADDQKYKAQGSQVLPGTTAFYDNFMFGENITNIKELIMKPYSVKPSYLDLKNLDDRINFITPELPGKNSLESESIATAAPVNDFGGHLEFFKKIFRWHRGSYTLRLLTNLEDDVLISVCGNIARPGNSQSMDFITTRTALDSTHGGQAWSSGHFTTMCLNTNMLPTFHLPYFAPRPFLPTHDYTAGGNCYCDYLPCLFVDFQIPDLSDEEKKLTYIARWYISAGDDFELSQLIGCPAYLVDRNFYLSSSGIAASYTTTQCDEIKF